MGLQQEDGSFALKPFPMITTGVAGLDVTLGGGLPANSLYLIQGLAGSGKTTLACQIGFEHARQGMKVLILTLLAESHAKMLSHLRNFSFFDSRLIGSGIVLFSGYGALFKDGLQGLLMQIAEMLTSEKPGMLIIDGFRSVRTSAASDLAMTEFVHSLNSLISSMGCTTFILSPIEGNATDTENTLVDGVIELGQHAEGMRLVRELQVYKLRGTDHLLGKHVFELKNTGVVIYPRFEAVRTYHALPQQISTEYVSTGIRSWDVRIGGGVPKGSTTCLLGSPGVGKTIMGLHFINEGLSKGEKCLIVGFHEAPAVLRFKADRVNLAIGEAIDDGRLEIMWQVPLELSVDDLATRMFANIKARGVSRVFLDDLEGLTSLVMHPEREKSFLLALTSELRALGVTSFFSEQLHYFKNTAPAAHPSSSSLYENVTLLEFVAHKSVNHRQISVLKLRQNKYDGTIRIMTITADGMAVGRSVETLINPYAEPDQDTSAT